MIGLSSVAKLAIGAALVAALAVMLALHACRREAGSAAAARVERGQAAAAAASGHDAVETIGTAQANETTIHEQVKEARDAIGLAPAGDANNVAERAACGMRSYRHSPRCVALLGAAAE